MKKVAFEKELAKYPGVTQDMLMEDAGLIQIDTPKGKVFTGNGCHTIVVAFSNHSQSWKPTARDEVVETLSYGVENCEIEDCDVCEEK